MSELEPTWLMRGVGRKPVPQEQLDERWKKLGLAAEDRTPNWESDDCTEWITGQGALLDQLPEGVRRSIIAESGSGKVALSLLARHPGRIHRVVLVNTKIDPYNLEGTKWERWPNLAESSVILLADLTNITRAARYRVLSLGSELDIDVKPEDTMLAGAFSFIMPGVDHGEGLRAAYDFYAPQLASFILRGHAPTSV